MNIRGLIKTIMISASFGMIFLLSTNSIFSATANNPCQKTQMDVGQCKISVTTCVTITDHNATVLARTRYDSGIITERWEGNLYNGPFSLRFPDGTEVEIDDPSLLPDEFDSVSTVSYYPPAGASGENFAEWAANNYQITFVNVNTGGLSCILEKTPTDSIPVLTTWKTSTYQKISDTSFMVLVQALQYADPSFEAMKLFPNPSNENITISFNFLTLPDYYPSIVGNSVDYLKIYNTNGETVYEEKNVSISGNKIIDTKSLPTGAYSIEIGKTAANLKWYSRFNIVR